MQHLDLRTLRLARERIAREPGLIKGALAGTRWFKCGAIVSTMRCTVGALHQSQLDEPYPHPGFSRGICGFTERHLLTLNDTATAREGRELRDFMLDVIHELIKREEARSSPPVPKEATPC